MCILTLYGAYNPFACDFSLGRWSSITAELECPSTSDIPPCSKEEHTNVRSGHLFSIHVFLCFVLFCSIITGLYICVLLATKPFSLPFHPSKEPQSLLPLIDWRNNLLISIIFVAVTWCEKCGSGNERESGHRITQKSRMRHNINNTTPFSYLISLNLFLFLFFSFPIILFCLVLFSQI